MTTVATTQMRHGSASHSCWRTIKRIPKKEVAFAVAAVALLTIGTLIYLKGAGVGTLAHSGHALTTMGPGWAYLAAGGAVTVGLIIKRLLQHYRSPIPRFSLDAHKIGWKFDTLKRTCSYWFWSLHIPPARGPRTPNPVLQIIYKIGKFHAAIVLYIPALILSAIGSVVRFCMHTPMINQHTLHRRPRGGGSITHQGWDNRLEQLNTWYGEIFGDYSGGALGARIEMLREADLTLVGADDHHSNLCKAIPELIKLVEYGRSLECGTARTDTLRMILLGLEDKMGACGPSWYEEACQLRKDLIGFTDQENQVLSWTQRIKEELILDVVQRELGIEWHGVNMYRGTIGNDIGLNPEDAKGDQYGALHLEYTPGAKKVFRASFNRICTEEAFIRGFAARVNQHLDQRNEQSRRTLLSLLEVFRGLAERYTLNTDHVRSLLINEPDYLALPDDTSEGDFPAPSITEAGAVTLLRHFNVLK